jgi:hypothetical protein
MFAALKLLLIEENEDGALAHAVVFAEFGDSPRGAG